jgi:ankyrin repeat protein
MESCFSEASSHLLNKCVTTNLGYTVLGEAHRRLLEDDVEGLEKILATESRNRKKMGVVLLFGCVHGASRCAKYLVEQGAMQHIDMAVCGETLSPFSPITIAALLGHWEVVKALVDGGAEPHVFDRFGVSALLVAAYTHPQGDLEPLLKLEDARGHINTASLHGITLLMVASASAVPLLVEAGAEVNLQTEDGGTALFHACHSACLEKVRSLMDYGADERLAGPDGVTPLTVAAIGGQVDIVEYLLCRLATSTDANINLADRALDMACLHGHLEVVELLVGAGARVESQARDDLEILTLATLGGNFHVIKYMVEVAKADINAVTYKTGEQPTACEVAAAHGRWDVVLYLVGHGADLSLCSPKVAIAAVETADVSLVARVLDGGLKATCRDEEGITPLHVAAWVSLAMVKLLVKAGATIDARDRRGRTPFMYACVRNRLDIVDWLAEAGADPCAQDNNGTTALAHATAEKHREVIDYLQSSKAQYHFSQVSFLFSRMPLRCLPTILTWEYDVSGLASRRGEGCSGRCCTAGGRGESSLSSGGKQKEEKEEGKDAARWWWCGGGGAVALTTTQCHSLSHPQEQDSTSQPSENHADNPVSFSESVIG